jgi:hypothetical protein
MSEPLGYAASLLTLAERYDRVSLRRLRSIDGEPFGWAVIIGDYREVVGDTLSEALYQAECLFERMAKLEMPE